MLAVHSAIARMPNPAILVDYAGCVVSASRAAIDAFAIPELGQPLAELFPLDELSGLLAKAIATDRAQQCEVVWEGQVVYATDLIPVTGVGVVLSMHDVTALKRLNAMKSSLTTIVSHDLRNPLGVAMGFAEILAEEPNLSAEARTCVEGIRSSLVKMLDMVNRALDIVRVETDVRGDSSTSDAAATIRHVIQDLGAQAATRGQEISTTIAPGLPPIAIDSVYLAEVLRRLLENAIRYAPEGSQVRLSAELYEGWRVLVRVEDSGPGIPAETLPRLFRRFYRGGSRRARGKQSTGLGLSIVRTIVENHGGQVGVESKRGRGSTFWFWLPAV